MKKVLIITYYWPPSGGSGVQRWLKFVKYLKDYAWEPIVYTPENPEYPEYDDSLFNDIPENITILKLPIWEPYSWYKKFTSQKKDQKISPSFLSKNKKPKLQEKISVWIRGNLFIPDARKFWIKPSVKFLNKYLKDHKIDVIISTGPPHSMHLIANSLKKTFNIPWIADFRDPWTNIDFYDELMLTNWADRKHHKLESEVIKNADCLITVSNAMKEDFLKAGALNVQVITNGFDSNEVLSDKIELDKKFSIAHIGTLVKSRNPEHLWKTLSELLLEKPELEKHLEIYLVGKVDFFVTESLTKYGLMKFVKLKEYVKHTEVLKIQKQSQILLLLINNTKNAKGIITGKIFEYLAAKRPIIAIGPVDGDVAFILKDTNAGEIIDFNDEYNLKKIIINYFNLFLENKLECNSNNIGKYSRKELTGSLSKILNQL